MLADTAKLAIDLSLTGNAAAGVKGVEQRLGSLNTRVSQVGKGFKTLGTGIGTAIKNGVLLAGVAIGGLTTLIANSVREGQEAAKVQIIYANAIENSGKVSTQYVKILNDQQKALMNLAGIGDELIKSSQTRLIQMGATGEQVAKLTPLILDFAKATGTDLETATKLVGKSLNGNTGALARYGVMIDKAKAKTDPFAATVEALNSKFAGTTKALSGSLEARLGALREGMANVREEAGMKLLPVLTRLVDVAGRKLVPAFSAFIDRMLPSIISGFDRLVDLLENGGAERGIKAITDALGPMVQIAKIAAAPIKAIVDAFLKLPPQVQGIIVGGLAVNKLSGGLVGQGLGEIIKGAIGGGGLLGRGSSPANPMYVSDVAGGLGGPLGKGSSLIPGALIATAIVAAAVPIGEAFAGALPAWLKGPNGAGESESQRRIREAREAEARNNKLLGGLLKGSRDSAPPPWERDNQHELKTIRSTMTALQTQMHTDFQTAIMELRKGTDPASIATAAASIVAGIKGGVGSAGTTRGAIGDLTAQRDAALASGNKPLAATLTQAIKQIEPFAKGRQWQQEQIAEARKIVSSNKTTADKVDALKRIEEDLLSHQRTMAGNIVNGLLDVVNAVNRIKFPGAVNAGGGPDTVHVPRDLRPGGPKSTPPRRTPNSSGSPDDRNITVNANVAVSTRDVNTAQNIKRRYGPTPTQAGAA